MMLKEFEKRILSSLILIPVAIFFIFKGTFFFIFFLIICLSVTLYEWQMMSKKKPYNIFGHIFLILSFYSAYLIRNEDEKSLYIFLAILLVCISTDIGGYIFGKILKGPKLTKISPKKTYSGVFGGYLLSIIVANFFIDYVDLNFHIEEFVIVIVISTISQIGDITVSYFKRLSKLKNTGKLIPGHGGILDRIDGMIFVFPFFYIINLIS
ncbi:MAG: phosphatidate cytidylyltransferase [Pelagibacterales bacterium MED-G41]|nr:MAG: phosphatidate cytidylyltransferase [Pelagibacterales bacterium MED-G41]|tara:strand:- start:660 stop:1289 length:630 start_codon:yes stop_codon:yes gene_type:complete